MTRSREAIVEEVAVLDDPRATIAELGSAAAATFGHKMLEVPVAMVAGAEKFLRKR